MDRQAAIQEIEELFKKYRRAISGKDRRLLVGLSKGKLYELYVLSVLVRDLASRGFTLAFKGTQIKFKSSPGKLLLSDPHFEIYRQRHPGAPLARIFVDIEVLTLGAAQTHIRDRSAFHEIDIIVTPAEGGNPRHDEILLGVECKAVANFGKEIIKQVLGVRRELSLFVSPQCSKLSAFAGRTIHVPADPPSEFWLAFIDNTGLNYKGSPAVFGIEFLHLQP